MKTTVATCLTVLFLSTNSFAQAVEGIDVFVLVDTSRSMTTIAWDYEKKKPLGGDGNDRLRIRWDAVKLLLDLLGPEDGVLIRRFSAYQQGFTKGTIAAPLPFPDFPDKLKVCSRSTRIELEKTVTGLNFPANPETPFDKEFDFGSTDIFGALESIQADAQESRRKGRHPLIILMTDGCDVKIKDYWDTDKTVEELARENIRPEISVDKLRNKLPQLLAPFNTVPTTDNAIAIYTIGLNLQDLKNYRPDGTNDDDIASPKLSANDMANFFTPYERDNAFELMKLLAVHSGGLALEAKQANDLLPLYRDLIRDLKKLWYSEAIVDPTQPKQLKTSVVQGIHDFRVLSYVENSANPNQFRKDSLRPPKGLHKNKYRWAESDKVPVVPAARHGTYQSAPLYDLLYFGPENSPSTYPFADVTKPVDFEVDLSDETESRTHVLWFKSVKNFFDFPMPKAPAYRHQLLSVNITTESNDFPATGFQFSLQSPEHERSGQSSAETARTYQLESSTANPNQVGVTFTPGLHFEQWDKKEKEKTLNLKLVAKGTRDALGNTHALTGFSRSFLPLWRLNVLNEFPLQVTDTADKTIERITLTRALIPEKFQLKVPFQFAPELNVPVSITFQPPKPSRASNGINGIPKFGGLPSSLFDLQINGKPLRLNAMDTTGIGSFDLQSSQATFSIVLNKDAVIPPKTTFIPGSLIFRVLLNDLSVPGEVKIPIELNNEELDIDFIEVKNNRKANSTTVNIEQSATTDSFLIQQRNPKKISTGTNQVKFEVEVVTPPMSLNGEPVEIQPTDYEIRKADESDKPNPDWAQDKWTLDQKVVFFIKAEQGLDSSRPALVKLIANGPGLGNAELKINLYFKNPEYLLANVNRRFVCTEGQTIPLSVGYTKLSDQRLTKLPKIHLDPEVHPGPIKFVRQEGPPVPDGEQTEFSVTLESAKKSWELDGAPSAQGELKLPIFVPGNLAPGEYQATFHFHGTQVVIKGPVVTLSVFVDRLEPILLDETDLNTQLHVAVERDLDQVPKYEFESKNWLSYPPRHYRLRFRSKLDQSEVTVNDFVINTPDEDGKVDVTLFSSAGHLLPYPVKIKPESDSKSWRMTVTLPEAANQKTPYIGTITVKDQLNPRVAELKLLVPLIDPNVFRNAKNKK